MISNVTIDLLSDGQLAIYSNIKRKTYWMLDFNLNYTAFFNCFVNTQSVIPYMYSYKGFQEFFMKIDLPEFPETDGEYEIKIPVKKVRINSEVEAYNIGFVIIAKAQ